MNKIVELLKKIFRTKSSRILLEAPIERAGGNNGVNRLDYIKVDRGDLNPVNPSSVNVNVNDFVERPVIPADLKTRGMGLYHLGKNAYFGKIDVLGKNEDFIVFDDAKYSEPKSKNPEDFYERNYNEKADIFYKGIIYHCIKYRLMGSTYSEYIASHSTDEDCDGDLRVKLVKADGRNFETFKSKIVQGDRGNREYRLFIKADPTNINHTTPAQAERTYYIINAGAWCPFEKDNGNGFYFESYVSEPCDEGKSESIFSAYYTSRDAKLPKKIMVEERYFNDKYENQTYTVQKFHWDNEKHKYIGEEVDLQLTENELKNLLKQKGIDFKWTEQSLRDFENGENIDKDVPYDIRMILKAYERFKTQEQEQGQGQK